MLTPEALPVLAEITLERDRQLTLLDHDPVTDDTAGPIPLIQLAGDEIVRAVWSEPDRRTALVKAAALIVAAIEVIDRQAGDL